MKSLYLLFLLSISIFFVQCSDDVPQNTWQSVTAKDGSEPVKRHEAAFVKVGTNFYLLGGRGIKPVSIYSTATESWSTGSESPIEIHHFQPVVIENRIYIIGALTGGYPDETPIANVLIYETDTDNWIVGDSIPTDRLRGSTGNVLYDGKIYVSCGIKNGHIGDHKKWLDTYDPKTGEWKVLPDAPRERDHFQAAVSNEKLYVVGGRLSKAPDRVFDFPVVEIDVFDLNAETWSTIKDTIPTPRAGNFAIPYNDEIIVVGGESGTQEVAHNEVEALNTTTNKWSSLSTMLQGRHGTGVLLHEDHIYVASGCGNRGGNPELATMEALYLK